MFNLEQAIADWRRQMLAAGIKAPHVVDELESHLREDVARQMESGLSAEQAFKGAVQRIGPADSLKGEFAKVSLGRWALLRKLKELLVGAVAPFPNVNAFDAGARQTLALARAEAPRLHHNFIGTEHVLLALLAMEKGVVPNVLRRMNVDRDSLRKRIEEWINIFPASPSTAHLPYTPRVKKALRLAAREAEACKHPCVRAEHIFLGLLLEGDGVAGRVLRDFGLTSALARKEILGASSGHQVQ